MKSEEDEAFDDLAKRQGDWGGGFTAKRKMAADKYSDIVSDGGLDPRNKMDAQPAQEPVAWVWKDMRGQDIVSLFEPRFNSVPLYTTPPQREWVGLTDADKAELAKAQHSWEDLCLAVESKLKERNHGT